MKKPKFQPYDLIYALEQAADFLRSEEWPEPADRDAQHAANREAAKRIEKMASRYARKHL